MTFKNVARYLLPLLIVAPLAGAAADAEFAAGELKIMQPWSRALPPVSPNGAAYFSVMNGGAASDRLLGVAVPTTVAKRAELHSHTMSGGMMRMGPVESIEIAPGEQVSLAPGGYHVMLMGLNKPLVAGESFSLTIEFERAGRVEVRAKVLPTGATGPQTGGDGHDAGGHDKSHGDDKQSDAAAHGQHDMAGGAGAGHAHDGIMDLDVATAPTLELSVVPLPGGAFALDLRTARLSFSEQHADGPHVAGEGHAHVYVDGKKVSRIYAPEYTLDALAPGAHEITVGLFTNDHAAYAAAGTRVAERVVVKVAPDREASSATVKRLSVSIHGGNVHGARAARVSQGDLVDLRFDSDAALTLHLHGYDITADVRPESPVTMQVAAFATGRFGVEAHGGPNKGHGHQALFHLEVYPK